MSTKNVISTAIPVVAMLDHLNKGSALSVIDQVVTAAQNANLALDSKFTNEVQQLPVVLNAIEPCIALHL